jgi:predicted ribosome quality control (RQC) complex YloA/Tae2 family protein
MNESLEQDPIPVILKTFQRGLKAVRKKIMMIEKAIEEAKNFPQIRQKGELLKCNIHAIVQGASFVIVENFYVNPPAPLRIELDPRKSKVDNLDEYFFKARKLEDGLPYELERLNEANSKAKEVEMLIAEFLENQDAEWGFKALEKNGFSKFLPIAPVKKETIRLTPLEKSLAKIKSFYSCDGFWIYVGGNAVENETVSFRVGSGKDGWMHVANVPGSHVVVKLNHKGDEIPHSTLLEAAMLAVHFSKYRDRSNVQVTVTTVNNVKKAKGAPVGTVHAHFTKAIKVSDSKDLLKTIIERTNQKKAK